MLKNVIILFIIVYPLYVLFTRMPDYFDGEFSRAVIHHVTDSSGNKRMHIVYSSEKIIYSVPADYLFRSYNEGTSVPIIYETAVPANASLYSVWGYWIRWQEVLSFTVMFVLFYFLAVNITSNPTPESLLEELEGSQPKPRKPRYD